MEFLVQTICEALVSHKEDVEISKKEQKDLTLIEIRVNKNDMGKIIGKQGRIAKAIRTVVKAAAIKRDKKIIVEIIE